MRDLQVLKILHILFPDGHYYQDYCPTWLSHHTTMHGIQQLYLWINRPPPKTSSSNRNFHITQALVFSILVMVTYQTVSLTRKNLEPTCCSRVLTWSQPVLPVTSMTSLQRFIFFNKIISLLCLFFCDRIRIFQSFIYHSYMYNILETNRERDLSVINFYNLPQICKL